MLSSMHCMSRIANSINKLRGSLQKLLFCPTPLLLRWWIGSSPYLGSLYKHLYGLYRAQKVEQRARTTKESWPAWPATRPQCKAS